VADGDFYVGYRARAPAPIGRFLRRLVLLLLLLVAGVAAALTASQGPFPPSVYEFGVQRQFVGWLSLEPVPSLYARIPGHVAAEPDAREMCGSLYSVYPLTRAGTKLGARDLAREWHGRLVRLRASLIHLDGRVMLDLFPDSIVALDEASARPAGQTVDLGVHTLVGEVVDTKCHLGLMNPATGKVHRACAARCISGGIPPALRLEDAAGRRALLLLVGRDGRSLGREVLPWVGEPVGVTGRVVRHDDLLVLYADPSDLRRL